MPIAILKTMNECAAQEFGAFYEEWFDRVYNYARHRTGSAVRADEIVSDTFTRVLDSWVRFNPLKGDRRTWLFSIAFRSVADHFRSEKRRRWMSLDFFSGPHELAAKTGPKREESDEQQLLLEALGRLNDQQREIVSLKFQGGLTNRAIAGLLGLTESNVGIILFRSVRKMRESFPGGGNGHE